MADWATTQRRYAFLVGEGTLTAQEARDWAFELTGQMPAPLPAHISPTEPLMLSVIHGPETRGLSGATILP